MPSVRRLSRLKQYSPGRRLRRLDRAAELINPFLLVLAIGLVILDLTCFLTLKIAGLPPRQADRGTAQVSLAVGSAPGVSVLGEADRY